METSNLTKASKKISQAKSLLKVMALLAVVGLVMDLTKHWGENSIMLAAFILNGVLILTYYVSAISLEKRPLLFSILPLLAFLVVQVLSFMGDPENYGGNAFWKILALLVLITILINMRQAKQLLQEQVQ